MHAPVHFVLNAFDKVAHLTVIHKVMEHADKGGFILNLHLERAKPQIRIPVKPKKM